MQSESESGCVYESLRVVVRTCIAFSLSPSHFDSNSGPLTVRAESEKQRGDELIMTIMQGRKEVSYET
jgi:hypothetical protein